MAVVLLLALLAPSMGQAATRLVISGAPAELEENIRLSVGSPPSDEDERALRRYTRTLPEQASTALAALGYYAADVDVKTRKVDNDTEVVISCRLHHVVVFCSYFAVIKMQCVAVN